MLYSKCHFFPKLRSVIGRHTVISMFRFLKYIIVVLTFLLVVSCNSWERISFSQREWQTKPQLRYQMLHDLVESDLILHKTASQVTIILGEPANRWDSLGRWRYDAGAVPEGLGVSFYSLYLTFREGKVDSTLIGKYHD